VRAVAALRTSVADPAVWVFPLLLLTLLPLGGAQLAAGIVALIAALAALQPRSAPRNWEHLIATMLMLTVVVGLTADALIGDEDDHRTLDYVEAPVPTLPTLPPDDGTVHDISDVEVPPRLNNSATVMRALERNYPPLLRDAGVGGTVSLVFDVRTDGFVEPETIKVIESDNGQFSEAAVEVVRRMRFTPAIINGRPVRVRANMPITFQAPRF
jgi:TonB family protein